MFSSLFLFFFFLFLLNGVFASLLPIVTIRGGVQYMRWRRSVVKFAVCTSFNRQTWLGLVQWLECPPHNPKVPGSKFRQDPYSLTYSRIAAMLCSVDDQAESSVDLVFLVCELGKWVSFLKQLHSSRLHYSDVE